MGGPATHQHSPMSVEHPAASTAASSAPLSQQATPHQDAKNAPTGLRVRTDELRRASSSPQETTYECPLRSNHCPALRPGPALGCNYCWNTIDSHGRILRRKTKYYCPECQTNLCIVPCFQAYHERATAPPGSKILPKTGSI
ncbi:uncharacterized protein LOC124612873 [Schistocerca americana]|nr:uncharacterized protein LOC124612873 [Schistocerca americana]